MEQKNKKKFIYINIWCDIVSFVTISQMWKSGTEKILYP
jgi:hypothetical protein